MVNYVQAGKSFPYAIDYIVGGEFVVPSAANITVQKPDGSYADSINNATLPVTTTSALYNISAAANAKTLTNELRYITVNFTYQGAVYTLNDSYMLKDTLLMPVTKDDVRALVSFSSTELPDSNIDLFLAYSQLQNDLGTMNLDSIFSTGSIFVPNAQRAIAAKAALNACTMIELMMYQSEQADNTLYKRFSSIDFEAMLSRLWAIYGQAIGEITTETPIDVPIFAVFTDTDPVTGA